MSKTYGNQIKIEIKEEDIENAKAEKNTRDDVKDNVNEAEEEKKSVTRTLPVGCVA